MVFSYFCRGEKTKMLLMEGWNIYSYPSSPGKSLVVKLNPTFSKYLPILHCMYLFLTRKGFCYLTFLLFYAQGDQD